MTDTTLLFTGIVVFGLMAIGVWMTILEFGQSGGIERETKENSSKHNHAKDD